MHINCKMLLSRHGWNAVATTLQRRQWKLPMVGKVILQVHQVVRISIVYVGVQPLEVAKWISSTWVAWLVDSPMEWSPPLHFRVLLRQFYAPCWVTVCIFSVRVSWERRKLTVLVVFRTSEPGFFGSICFVVKPFRTLPFEYTLIFWIWDLALNCPSNNINTLVPTLVATHYIHCFASPEDGKDGKDGNNGLLQVYTEEYMVYLAEDAYGTGRSQVESAVPVGPGSRMVTLSGKNPWFGAGAMLGRSWLHLCWTNNSDESCG